MNPRSSNPTLVWSATCGIICILLSVGCAGRSSDQALSQPFELCDRLGVSDNLAFGAVTTNMDVNVAVGTEGLIATSNDGTTWTVVDSSTTLPISDVTWDGDTFVAIASRNPTSYMGQWHCWESESLVSKDGFNWETFSLPIAGELQAVRQANGITILGGRSKNGGAIWLSRNGRTEWVITEFSFLTTIVDILWTGREFVAVGNGPEWKAYVLTSIDGLNWNHTQVSAVGWLGGIVKSASGIYAVGAHENDPGVFYSRDDREWTRLAASSAGWLSGVAANGSDTIAVGRNGLAVKANGENLQVRTVGTDADLYDIEWTGKAFVAVGGVPNFDRPTIVTSANGDTWATVTLQASTGP